MQELSDRLFGSDRTRKAASGNQHAAAIRVQAAVRGKAVRTHRQASTARQHAAATKVQAAIRGRRVRRGQLVMQPDGKLKRIASRGAVVTHEAMDERSMVPRVSHPGRESERGTKHTTMLARVWSRQRAPVDGSGVRRAAVLPKPQRLPSVRAIFAGVRTSRRLNAARGSSRPSQGVTTEEDEEAAAASTSTSSATRTTPLPLTVDDVDGRVLRVTPSSLSWCAQCQPPRLTRFRKYLLAFLAAVALFNGFWFFLGWFFAW